MKKKFISYYIILITVLLFYNNCSPSFESHSTLDQSSFGLDRSPDGAPTFKGAYKSGPMNQSSFRKLTNNEIYNKIKKIFAIEFNVQMYLGEEPLTPFNNTIKDQLISENLINNVEYFARTLTNYILNSNAAKSRFINCQPKNSNDGGCLDKIILALFEPTFTTIPSSLVINNLKNKALELAQEANDFNVAIETVLLFTFQSPRFLYTEYGGGRTSNGVYRLSEIEYANKISYFITGAPADTTLIDHALKNNLSDSQVVAFEIERLFNTPQATRQLMNFHSMWFGYYQSQLPPVIAVNAIQETELVLKEHLIDQNRNWMELLQLDYTYVNNALAAHYNFPSKGANGFYKYNYSDTNQPRKGILSHATFLSAFPKIGDSSPTKRGYHIIKSLLCDQIGQPPEDVDLDVLPEPTNGGNCKEDSYIALKTMPACMGCHIKMDNIGLGLENYNHLGQYRTVEQKNKSCKIDGEGEVYNMGGFEGLTGFADLLYNNRTTLQNCLVEKMNTFAFGFNTKDVHPGYLQNMQEKFNNHGSYKNLVRDIILSEEFRNIIWK